MQLKHLAVGAVVYAALLVAATAAFGQTASQSGYSAPAGSVQQQLAHHDPPTRDRATSGNIGGVPFTGLDLGLVGGAGGILLAVGFAVRRAVDSVTP